MRNQFVDVTTHLGGPVLRDRLWFFGGYQYQRDQDSGPGADSRFPRESNTDRIFWKINWQISSNLKLMHSYHDDYWGGTGPFTISYPYESGTDGSGNNPSLTFANITDIVSANTFWDARVSGYYWNGMGVPRSGYTESPHYDVATGIGSGGSYNFWSGTEHRTVAHGKLSDYATDFLGADHDFKFGVQWMDAGTSNLFGNPGGAIYYDYYGEPYYAVFREPYVYGGDSRSLGVYAEDTANIGDRLALNLVVRFDRASAVSPDLEQFNAIGEKTGSTTLYTWNALSPRLGFNLKLTEDGRTLLQGSWGRYHQGVFVSEPAAVHPGITPQTIAYYGPLTGEYSDVVAVLEPTAQLASLRRRSPPTPTRPRSASSASSLPIWPSPPPMSTRAAVTT